ncbi:hypothetical protein N9B28_02780 [bacterium]|nr:hypothetical protein [bacterium]
MSGIGLDEFRFQRPVLDIGESAILRIRRRKQGVKKKKEREFHRLS